MARQVLENGVVLPAEYSDDWYDDMTSNLTKLDDVIGSDSEKLSSADVGAAALSNNYNDLDNLPTIPTVNDAVLTIQKNGVDVQTFTANASSNVTANITVPTKTSDITNDSNFVDTSNAAVASGITSAKVTSYDAHIADTDIHVTTADKNKWNNNTYVFRYSSTALVASSTNSNALLDNTDNLKVGDKVIDSSGVLFSITAIDTQNSTFTIGTALIDLAQDSDVVHKSGNETVGGSKTFNSNAYIYNSDTTANTPYLYLKNSKTTKGSTSEIGAQLVKFVDKNNSSLCDIESIVTSTGSCELRLGSNTLDSNNQNVQTGVTLISSTNGGKRFCPTSDNSVSCGYSTLKWSDVQTYKVNGLEPSSLSLPSGNVSDVIDISSYITDLSGYPNDYVAPSNGFVSISATGTGLNMFIAGTALGVSLTRTTSGSIKHYMPILKNQTAKILIIASSLEYVKFIPCQGNV